MVRVLIKGRMQYKKPIEPINYWKIIKGDEVEIISGKSKGKQGIVEAVDRKRNVLFVSNTHTMKKHIRGTPDKPGRIVEKLAPIHYSNAMLLDPVKREPTRVSIKYLADGKRVRISKVSGAVVEKKLPEFKKRNPGNKETDTPLSLVLQQSYVRPAGIITRADYLVYKEKQKEEREQKKITKEQKQPQQSL